MSAITIEAIKAEHAKLGDMIAAFEHQQQRGPTSLHLPEMLIDLAPRERYAGLLIGEDGKPSYHLVLMPDQRLEADWEEANEWAKRIGGDLPTRSELALLFANLPGEFEKRLHWSCEAYVTEPSWAWCQAFVGGDQRGRDRRDALRARAVRRLLIV